MGRNRKETGVWLTVEGLDQVSGGRSARQNQHASIREACEALPVQYLAKDPAGEEDA